METKGITLGDGTEVSVGDSVWLWNPNCVRLMSNGQVAPDREWRIIGVHAGADIMVRLVAADRHDEYCTGAVPVPESQFRAGMLASTPATKVAGGYVRGVDVRADGSGWWSNGEPVEDKSLTEGDALADFFAASSHDGHRQFGQGAAPPQSDLMLEPGYVFDVDDFPYAWAQFVEGQVVTMTSDLADQLLVRAEDADLRVCWETPHARLDGVWRAWRRGSPDAAIEIANGLTTLRRERERAAECEGAQEVGFPIQSGTCASCSDVTLVCSVKGICMVCALRAGWESVPAEYRSLCEPRGKPFAIDVVANASLEPGQWLLAPPLTVERVVAPDGSETELLRLPGAVRWAFQ